MSSNNFDIENSINIIGYIDSSSPFICPGDGVIQISTLYYQNEYVSVVVNGLSTVSVSGNGAVGSNAIYRVFKGDKVYLGINGSNIYATFIPIIYYP